MRCFGDNNLILAKYHDEEWGRIILNDGDIFEMLILEGAQAGLNWLTILKKRENYKILLHNYDIKKISLMSNCELNNLLKNKKIIRNKAKIYSIRRNALIFLQIQKEFKTFSSYIWKYINFSPIISAKTNLKEINTFSPLSIKISQDLKNRGMNFVGPTIIYSFMQAIGMINDHIVKCDVFNKTINQNKNNLELLKKYIFSNYE